MTNNEIIITELNSETIESMIYEIRGQRVMLDFELAKIYGYETKAFNQQVKNNIIKFPDRYRFQLTKAELDMISKSLFVTMKEKDKLLARSKNLTAQLWATNEGGRTVYPHAFTEQGI